MAYRGEVKVPGTHVRHGEGTYQFANKCFKYSGTFVDGRRHGSGILELPGGGNYEGQFTDGEITGQGLRRWPSGQTYSGAFKWGEMHGQGSMVKSNGDRYEGSFDSNCWHGIGEFTSADGTVYEGEFTRNKFHGQGSITYSEKHCGDLKAYAGSWRAGLLDGDGECMYRDDSRFQGTWVNQKRTGEGSYEGSNGFTYRGKYSQGRPTEAASRIKLVSDDPIDEEALAEVAIENLWTLAAAIEIPREEEDDDEDDCNQSKPKGPEPPAFRFPTLTLQVLGVDGATPCTTECGHVFKLSLREVIDDVLECDKAITMYNGEDYVLSASSAQGIVEFEGVELGSGVEDGEYVVIIDDANNQPHFNDCEEQECVPRCFAARVFAGISDPNAGKKAKGKKKK